MVALFTAPQHVPTREQRLEILTRCNVADLLSGLRVEEPGLLRSALAMLGRLPARGFARALQEYDDLVGEAGMVAGADLLVRSFTRSVTVSGQERVPPRGPVLVVANHPGLVDAMALVVALQSRPDLRIVAADRDLLRAVPHVSSRLLYVHPERGGRSGLVRDVVGHLSDGGAVLTFPAGRIEPDPALDDAAAAAALAAWTDSTAMFLRRVPDTLVLPAAVAGVVSRRAFDHPLAKRLPGSDDRDRAAATLQVLWPPYRDTHTTVRIGRALSSGRSGRSHLVEAMTHLLRPVATDDAAPPPQPAEPARSSARQDA